jgi:hypothetical protein
MLTGSEPPFVLIRIVSMHDHVSYSEIVELACKYPCLVQITQDGFIVKSFSARTLGMYFWQSADTVVTRARATESRGKI